VGEGLGVRLDQSGYQGLEVTPYYDSLLSKVTALTLTLNLTLTPTLILTLTSTLILTLTAL